MGREQTQKFISEFFKYRSVYNIGVR